MGEPVHEHDQGRTRTPSYQGRSLARPGEEIVDQGPGFDVGTLLSRRRILQVLGLGAATVGLAACGGGGSASSSATATAASGEIPDETAGPYPGDGSNGPDVCWSRAGSSAVTSAPASASTAGPPRACR
jgi:hypothetical protein